MKQEEWQRVGRSIYGILGSTSEQDRRGPDFSDDGVHEGDIVIGYVVIDFADATYRLEEGSDKIDQR